MLIWEIIGDIVVFQAFIRIIFPFKEVEGFIPELENMGVVHGFTSISLFWEQLSHTIFPLDSWPKVSLCSISHQIIIWDFML